MPAVLPLRHSRAVQVGLALALAVLVAVLGTPAVSVDPVRVVVAYDGVLDSGQVQVRRTMPALGMAVVEGTPAALRRLARTEGVRAVSPDSPVTLTGRAATQDAVHAADGLGGRAGTAAAGRGIRVAVVDTGVSDSAALSRSSGRLVDAFDSGDGPRPYDDGYGHGTFMASVVAGGPVDGSGGRAVGVAPGATVLVVRVAEPDGSTSLSQVLAGLDWVAANPEQVDVANLSFSHERPGAAYGSDPLTDAVEAVRDAGVTVVVSAGNEPHRVGDPGFTPRALTVGAADLTTREAAVADFSGSDVVAGVSKPDLIATGVSVLGVLPPGSVLGAARPPVAGSLWRGSGTSQATAVVSGVAALLLEKRPQATPGEVKAALRSAARPLAGERDGAGLVRVASSTRPGRTEPGPGVGHGDPTGEAGFDANSWSANSWSANSWSANSWSANSWSANSWSTGGGTP